MSIHPLLLRIAAKPPDARAHRRPCPLRPGVPAVQMREIDERFEILGPIERELEDVTSWVHLSHTQLQMVRQRVYQMAAGYEDCNDADFLRIDPALRRKVHVAYALSLARAYRGVFGWRQTFKTALDRGTKGVVCQNRENAPLIRQQGEN